jgi:metal-responsive CopG/Arc/MetJ family transcriptional regulator
MGRPKATDKMANIGLCVPESWLAELEAAAARRGMPRYEYVRRALRRVLDGEARPTSN